MGQGIVQPVDDFSDNNPPSHPEVLNLLAEQFAAHDYDLKFLVRTITLTRVYQTTSRQTHASQADPTHLLARLCGDSRRSSSLTVSRKRQASISRIEQTTRS